MSSDNFVAKICDNLMNICCLRLVDGAHPRVRHAAACRPITAARTWSTFLQKPLRLS